MVLGNLTVLVFAVFFGVTLGLVLLYVAFFTGRGGKTPPMILTGGGAPHQQPVPARIPLPASPQSDVNEDPPILSDEVITALAADDRCSGFAEPSLSDGADSAEQDETAESDETDEIMVVPPDSPEYDLPIMRSFENPDHFHEPSGTTARNGNEAELTDLQLALEASAQELTYLSASRDQALSVVSNLEQTIHEMRLCLGQYEASHASLQREKGDLATQLRDWQRTADGLRTKLDATAASLGAPAAPLDEERRKWEDERRQWEGERRQWEDERRRMKEELDALRDASASLAPEATRELTELRTANQQVVADLSLANETIRQLNLHVSRREGLVVQLDYEKRTLESRIASLEHELTSLSQSYDTLRTEQESREHDNLESLRRESEKQLAESESAMASLRRRVQDAMEANSGLSREVTEAKAESATLAAEAKAIRHQAAEWEQEKRKLQSQLDESANSVAHLDASLVAAKRRLAETTAQHNEHLAQIRHLRTELDESKLNAIAGTLPQDRADENGRPRRGARRKPSSRPAGGTSGRVDERFGEVHDQRPTEVGDLRLIRGIGPVLESRLNSIGIYQIQQLAHWNPSVIAHVDQHLKLGGRIDRDAWVAQAQALLR